MNRALIEINPDELDEWAHVLSIVCDWFTLATWETRDEFNDSALSLRFDQLASAVVRITIRIRDLAEAQS